MMFSLQALLTATQATPRPKPDPMLDEASEQLWSMQAATPLFGTAHDQALLTTPLKLEPAQSMDSMTLPSETPNGRRWWPLVVAAGAGLALASAGVWVYGGSNGTSPVSAATPSEPPALVAQPLAVPSPDSPTPSSPLGEAPAKLDQPAASSEPAASPEPGTAEPELDPSRNDAPSGAAASGPEVNAPKASAVASSRPAPDRERAGKDKPGNKKPTARFDKASAPPKLGASIFAFDKVAAKSALNAAAQSASGCGAGGDPGKGKVQITFAPTGKVSDAQLVEGPFAGTSAGKCALRYFKAAKVPAFSGAPVTVSKSFRVD